METGRDKQHRDDQSAAEKESLIEQLAETDRRIKELQQQDIKQQAVCDQGKARPIKAFKPIDAISADVLDTLDIPPVEWLVHGILPVGVSMIGAPSKYYKSYMALDLCISICNGKQFLHFDTNKHACLYLDLESTKRRPRSRLKQILGKQDKPGNLYIITGEDDPGRIGEGFAEQIEYQLQAHPDIKLVVIDVFQLIRSQKRSGQDGYERDYEDFKVLKKIADSHSIGLMLIHHTRKMRDPADEFNNLSGSAGIMGALDCAWVISKDDRYSDEATLYITGRDLSSQQLKIRFNHQSFRWEYVGTAEDIEEQRLRFAYDQSPIIETVKKLLKQGDGQWKGTVTDIKNACKVLLKYEPTETPQQIGVFLNQCEIFLSFDGITHDYDPRDKKRLHKFFSNSVAAVAADAADAADAAVAADAVQERLNGI